MIVGLHQVVHRVAKCGVKNGKSTSTRVDQGHRKALVTDSVNRKPLQDHKNEENFNWKTRLEARVIFFAYVKCLNSKRSEIHAREWCTARVRAMDNHHLE